MSNGPPLDAQARDLAQEIHALWTRGNNRSEFERQARGFQQEHKEFRKREDAANKAKHAAKDAIRQEREALKEALGRLSAATLKNILAAPFFKKAENYLLQQQQGAKDSGLKAKRMTETAKCRMALRMAEQRHGGSLRDWTLVEAVAKELLDPELWEVVRQPLEEQGFAPQLIDPCNRPDEGWEWGWLDTAGQGWLPPDVAKDRRKPEPWPFPDRAGGEPPSTATKFVALMMLHDDFLGNRIMPPRLRDSLAVRAAYDALLLESPLVGPTGGLEAIGEADRSLEEDRDGRARWSEERLSELKTYLADVTWMLGDSAGQQGAGPAQGVSQEALHAAAGRFLRRMCEYASIVADELRRCTRSSIRPNVRCLRSNCEAVRWQLRAVGVLVDGEGPDLGALDGYGVPRASLLGVFAANQGIRSAMESLRDLSGETLEQVVEGGSGPPEGLVQAWDQAVAELAQRAKSLEATFLDGKQSIRGESARWANTRKREAVDSGITPQGQQESHGCEDEADPAGHEVADGGEDQPPGEHKVHPDGLGTYNLLWWQDQPHELPPKVWKLLKFMWDREKATVNEVIEHAWPELWQNGGSPEDGAIRGLLHRTNKKLSGLNLGPPLPFTRIYKDGAFIVKRRRAHRG